MQGQQRRAQIQLHKSRRGAGKANQGDITSPSESSKQETRCGKKSTKDRSFEINKTFSEVQSVLCVWEHKKKLQIDMMRF